TFELYQNYPNPFNAKKKIKYKLNNQSQRVRLSIYDVNGKLVEKLFDGIQADGTHTVNWNASKYSSGTYFCRINVDRLSKSIKLVYLK
ncbi:MAG TPA: T9SS type A sorting domain-containing protein, partial [Ignavibacteriaceae bacterium]|nr:T9SS type A sorting domain-containing protein [Ignavibacteriaceae bacterium]